MTANLFVKASLDIRRRSFILPSLIGNALEYYDFTIFAVFSSEIAKQFFPQDDDFSEIFFSFAVFAVGFVMRPIGAIVFGHIGDKVGRKKALTLSIFCMAIPTLMIGLLPGYESFGILATFFLVLLRLIQGLSIGGEGAGSAIFILEHNQTFKAGYLGGIISASNFIGAFLATLIGIMISHFTSNVQGWRLAFILGGLLGIVGFYLRIKTFETPVFEKILREKAMVRLPMIEAISNNKRQMLLSLCLGGLVGAFAYMMLAYINVFFNKILGLDTFRSLTYSALGLACFIFFLPLFGLWSDKIKHHRSMVNACVCSIFFIMPIFMMMTFHNASLNTMAIIFLGAVAAWICAPAYPIMLNIFPAQYRYSGIAFSFNLGLAIFGGTAPIISAFLTKATGLLYAPAFYLMSLALLYCVCYFWFSRSMVNKYIDV